MDQTNFKVTEPTLIQSENKVRHVWEKVDSFMFGIQEKSPEML